MKGEKTFHCHQKKETHSYSVDRLIIMSLWQEMQGQRIRSLKTVCLLFGWLCLGLCAGVVGPTLLDLRQQTQEQTDRISYALSARSAGVVVGSLIGESLVLELTQELIYDFQSPCSTRG